MATKRTKSEEPASPPAKPAPKRKVAARPGISRKPAAVAAVATVAAPPKAAQPAALKAPKAAKPKPKPVEISTEVIALRAYFISEARQKAGLPGDETTDWLEAEKQIRAEIGA